MTNPSRTDRLKIVVGVYIVRGPMGPLSWHYLEYAVGLAQLGHEVTVIEDSDDHEWTCYDPRTATLGIDATYGLEYARRCLRPFGLEDRLAYFDAHGGGWTGPAAPHIERELRDADVYINVSGANIARTWLEHVPRRVFIDTDPGFVQVKNLTMPARRDLCEQHNVHLSFGERVGQADCLIPDDGFPWRPTRQPVVLDAWPQSPPPPGAPFTTVMRWDSYEPKAYEGLSLGMKSQSFAPLLELPQRTSVQLEMAVGPPCPSSLLVDNGWRLRDPHVVAPDPFTFVDYVAASAGEFTVAKQGYVTTRSGWFSERSAHYLASGRAVVTEDTGFSDFLPIGEGLLTFTDVDTAAEALEKVSSNPERHATTAREIAAEYFDSRTVLTRLLEEVSA